MSTEIQLKRRSVVWSTTKIVDIFPSALDVTSSTLSPRKRQAAIDTVIAAAQRATNEGALNLPVAADASFSEKCEASGSMTIKITGDENSGSMSLTMNNCREDEKGGEYTITNGKASLSYKANSFEMTFKDFKTVEHYEGETSTVVVSGYYKVIGADWASSTPSADRTEEWHFYGTDNGKSFSASGSSECKAGACVYSSVVKDANGKVYRVSDLEIKNAYQDEYQLTAKVYHPDHGHYLVKINSEWSCERSDPSPFVGTATLTSENSTIKYKSTSCSVAPTITLN